MHPLVSSFEKLKSDGLKINDHDWSENALTLSSKLIDVHQFRLAKNLLLVAEIKSIFIFYKGYIHF